MRTRANKKSGPSVVLTDYFASRIDWENKSDPLMLQVIPGEQEKAGNGVPDFCGEKKFLATDFLIHRYPDRAVLLASSQCFCRCRFCFRKGIWGRPDKAINDSELQRAIKYFGAHPGIRELIISGGDPLTLSNRKLNKIINSFATLSKLNLIRVASRALTFLPARIDAGLVSIFKKSRKQVWFVSHFNHSDELGRESLAAITRLRLAGISILNQTVLLKGVNDCPDILAELFGGLAKAGVKPYYLFQCDPAPGVSHFSTDLQKSIEIYEELCRSSGLIVPRFAFELPGYGKVSPGPGWDIIKTSRGYRLTSPGKKKYFYPF
jgi:lysine 2,3-aminomutase